MIAEALLNQWTTSEKHLFQVVVTGGTISGVSWSTTAGVTITEPSEGYALVGPFAAGNHVITALATLSDGQVRAFRWNLRAVA